MMQISTKGRYALRFLLDLCQHQEDGYVSLKSIAERQDISKKYLEHIVSMFNPTGLLNISRGYQGGYQLGKDPSEVTVADVLRITEGGLAPVSCLDGEVEGCERREDCLTLGVWKGLERVISEYLESISLQDILDEYGPTVEYYI
jgi:Rrf2 family protein